MPAAKLPRYATDYQKTPEYTEGQAAFRNGRPNSANPYPSGPLTGDSRYRWYMGWGETHDDEWFADCYQTRYDAILLKGECNVDL